MDRLFNEPILNQIYKLRKEKFEKFVYNKVKEIIEKYHNVKKVFEYFETIVLNKKDMKRFFELRDVDIKTENLEQVLCVKLEMKEVINL